MLASAAGVQSRSCTRFVACLPQPWRRRHLARVRRGRTIEIMHALRCLLAAALATAVLQAADAPSASGIDLKAMDTAASPCQNFYRYACGAWRKNNPVPPDQSRWARFNELAERNLAI